MKDAKYKKPLTKQNFWHTAKGKALIAKHNEQFKNKEPTFPHFREHYKDKPRPALIIGERNYNNKPTYLYREVTHSPTHANSHSHEPVRPNADFMDKEHDTMYINKSIRSDHKSNFSTWIYPWKYK